MALLYHKQSHYRGIQQNENYKLQMADQRNWRQYATPCKKIFKYRRRYAKLHKMNVIINPLFEDHCYFNSILQTCGERVHSDAVHENVSH